MIVNNPMEYQHTALFFVGAVSAVNNGVTTVTRFKTLHIVLTFLPTFHALECVYKRQKQRPNGAVVFSGVKVGVKLLHRISGVVADV